MTTVPFLTSALRTGLPFGVIMGVFFAFQSGLVRGMVSGAFAGILFGLLMASFAKYQAKSNSVKRPDFENEDILEEGPANHFLNGEGVGGWLYLTDKRFFFKSHAFNIQRHELSIPLSEIVKLTKAKSLGIISNQLCVDLIDSTTERFVLNRPDLWIGKFEKQTSGK